MGPLQFELGCPTPGTTQNFFDEMDFQRAVQAYLWAYPAVSFESIRLTAERDLGMRYNDLGIADNFVDPRSMWLTANDTTIYAFVNIDLAEGPVAVEIPPGAIVGLLDDFWQSWLSDVGLPGPDAGAGGTFLLLPPGYDGDVPASGYHMVRATMNNLNLLVRGILIDGDIPDAVARVRQVKVYPWSEQRRRPEPVHLHFGRRVRHDSARWHRVLGEACRCHQPQPGSSSRPLTSWPCSSRSASRRASPSSRTHDRPPSWRRRRVSVTSWPAT